MTTPTRLPTLIPIPPATIERRCAGCGAPIYWVHRRRDGPPPQPGHLVPVSLNLALHPDCLAPTKTTSGQGVNHFIDCPSRDSFKRPR